MNLSINVEMFHNTAYHKSILKRVLLKFFLLCTTTNATDRCQLEVIEPEVGNGSIKYFLL